MSLCSCVGVFVHKKVEMLLGKFTTVVDVLVIVHWEMRSAQVLSAKLEDDDCLVVSAVGANLPYCTRETSD